MGRGDCYIQEKWDTRIGGEILAFAQEHGYPLQCLLQASSTPENSN
jgi:hypothetical protein